MTKTKTMAKQLRAWINSASGQGERARRRKMVRTGQVGQCPWCCGPMEVGGEDPILERACDRCAGVEISALAKRHATASRIYELCERNPFVAECYRELVKAGHPVQLVQSYFDDANDQSLFDDGDNTYANVEDVTEDFAIYLQVATLGEVS